MEDVLHDVGHGLGGIADVFIKGVWSHRSLEAEFSLRMKIQSPRFGLFRRPGVELAPLVSAGFENVRFDRFPSLIVFQIVTEKGQFDFLPVKFGGFGTEVSVAQLIPVLFPPIAVGPWTHHKEIGSPGVQPLRGPMDFEGSKQIFRIIPAADRHHGAADVFEMGADIAGLPKGIVGGMGEKLSPFRGAAAQEFGVGFSQRAHAQEEVITISGVEVEGLQRLMQWILGALGELIEKIEILREKERAIVVEIIAHEPIGNRCLGGRRLQRRMGIDHAHGGVKSRIPPARRCPITKEKELPTAHLQRRPGVRPWETSNTRPSRG